MSETREWPNCPTPDCQYKVCLWAGMGHCYRCSTRLLSPVGGQWEMDRRYRATHDADGNWTGKVESEASR